ncbi:ADP-ribosylglycohydrolase family protein, partial [Candidatus Bipolaricaulota bacterium]|nr:ADP-ribosylglycohydrolase family protein [Candidatus Bipolaricaulota bacterium]
MEKSDLLESVTGCLAGVAIGDAMGLPTQFMTPEGIKAEFGQIEGFEAPPDWHPYGDSTPGTVTDDTEQTLALAVALIAEGGDLTPAGTAEALLGWAREHDLLGTDEIGPSTGKALKAIEGGKNPKETGFSGTTNGASMRISPIGLIHPLVHEKEKEKLWRAVRRACTPTHNTPIAIGGATTVATAIAEGVSGTENIDRIIKSAKESGVTAFRESEEELPRVSEINEEKKMNLLLGRVSPSLSRRIEMG